MDVDYGIELVYLAVGKAAPEEPETEVLQTFLRTGSPNPAAGRATIEFGLKQTGPVTLAIYDVSGRKVRTLVQGTLGPGVHVRPWDGRDDAGRDVAAGIYLVKLAARDKVFTEKLVLAR
jgi:hypothetical protein